MVDKVLSEKIKALRFRLSVFKVKHSHMKLLKYDLKILKFCMRYMNKICIPVTEAENETMKKLFSVYDETIAELNKNVDIYRRRIVQ